MREAINDIYCEKAKKLDRTIHAISVQNDLLKHENEQLKEALANEKKRRNRGKALLLEPTPEYHGGACFYSPQKVAEARERQIEKQLQIKTSQHQKDEAKRLREQQKLRKAEELELRRIMRAVAKEERAEKNAQKAADREERIANQQLQKQLQSELKSSKKQKLTEEALSLRKLLK